MTLFKKKKRKEKQTSTERRLGNSDKLNRDASDEANARKLRKQMSTVHVTQTEVFCYDISY